MSLYCVFECTAAFSSLCSHPPRSSSQNKLVTPLASPLVGSSKLTPNDHPIHPHPAVCGSLCTSVTHTLNTAHHTNGNNAGSRRAVADVAAAVTHAKQQPAVCKVHAASHSTAGWQASSTHCGVQVCPSQTWVCPGDERELLRHQPPTHSPPRRIVFPALSCPSQLCCCPSRSAAAGASLLTQTSSHS